MSIEANVFKEIQFMIDNGHPHDFDLKPMAVVNELIDLGVLEVGLAKIDAAVAVSKWRAENAPKPVKVDQPDPPTDTTGFETLYYGMTYHDGGRVYTYHHASKNPVEIGAKMEVDGRNGGRSTVTVVSRYQEKPSFATKPAYLPVKPAATDAKEGQQPATPEND